MTDQNQSLRDDIAFMRGLAEAGQDRPMAGGSILLACGVIFGGASLVVWWLSSRLGMDGAMYPLVWGAASALYFAFLIPLLRSLPRTGNAKQIAAGMAWSGVGWSSFTIVVSLIVMSVRSGDWLFMWTLPSVFMCLYGAVWFLAAVQWRKGWLWATALGAFAAALVNAWFASEGQLVWLLFGISLLLVMGLPGLHLMRQARAA